MENPALLSRLDGMSIIVADQALVDRLQLIVTSLAHLGDTAHSLPIAISHDGTESPIYLNDAAETIRDLLRATVGTVTYVDTPEAPRLIAGVAQGSANELGQPAQVYVTLSAAP